LRSPPRGAASKFKLVIHLNTAKALARCRVRPDPQTGHPPVVLDAGEGYYGGRGEPNVGIIQILVCRELASVLTGSTIGATMPGATYPLTSERLQIHVKADLAP
jgi:hypothetical protein